MSKVCSTDHLSYFSFAKMLLPILIWLRLAPNSIQLSGMMESCSFVLPLLQSWILKMLLYIITEMVSLMKILRAAKPSCTGMTKRALCVIKSLFERFSVLI